MALDILKSRPSLFGHILHSDRIPENTAMLQFFENSTNALPHRGLTPTTLPFLLHYDLLLVNKNRKSPQDFQKIKQTTLEDPLSRYPPQRRIFSLYLP